MILIEIPLFFQKIGQEGLLQFLAILIPSWAVFMIVLERIFPYTKGIKLFRRGFWMDLVWYTILQSKVLEIVIFYWIILNTKSALGLQNFGPLSDWNFYFLIFFFFITHDFYIYWFHRLQHNNKWLWRTHEAHHSGREVDWLAGSRSHFTEILINQTIEFAPIFFLLDSETAAYVYPIKAAMDALWGMWIHANVNVNTGKLQYIINGPEMHQWHHANHKEVFYKNYSTKIAIWDWIFGTAFLPKLKPISFYLNKPKMYGLPYKYPKGFWVQLFYAFVRFDFSKIEQNRFYQYVLYFRRNVISGFLELFGVSRQNTEVEVFGEKNKRYNLDEMDPKCEKCGTIMKYYIQEDNLINNCEACANYDFLAKFN